MNLELCTDSLEGAKAASRYGLQRIELCAALEVGGLTPSYALIESCAKEAIDIHVMIRPREGNFCYSEEELDIMSKDIEFHKKAGASGVVFGVLDEQGFVSSENRKLLDIAKKHALECTFHRAFDLCTSVNDAIEKLVSWKFDRLLTSGQQETALAGIDLIRKLQDSYGNSIQIMAGSGINAQNAVRFQEIGLNNLHFTARTFLEESQSLGMGTRTAVDEQKIKDLKAIFTQSRSHR